MPSCRVGGTGLLSFQPKGSIKMRTQAGNFLVGCNVSMEPYLLIERTQ